MEIILSKQFSSSENMSCYQVEVECDEYNSGCFCVEACGENGCSCYDYDDSEF